MQKYKSLVLPFAIVVGLLFHSYMAFLKPIVPYLIFSMLLLSFSLINIRNLKICFLDIWLLLFQIVVSLGCYLLLRPFNGIVAEGVLVGVLCPVASSLVVISCMLGANLERVTTYTMVGNLGIAFVAPIYFSFIGAHVTMPFGESALLILSKVTPIIVLPLLVTVLFQHLIPKINNFLVKYQGLSFYLWACVLTITLGQTIDFVYLNGEGNGPVILWLAVASVILCIIQFGFGKFIGKKYGDTIGGGQSLGQKNTAMGIWMAYTYLHPLASIYPAAYSICQNLFNSYQIWQYNKKRNLNYIVLCLMVFFSVSAYSPAKAKSPDKKTRTINDVIKPGGIWPDENGNHLQAHGGGIIKIKGTYYWYGEQRGQNLDPNYRYVSCYSSEDLMNWKFNGNVLKMTNPDSLASNWVLERPKVFYNNKTKKYVMYFHIDADYKLANVGLAVCDNPTGEFKYVKRFRPLGHESRDIGQFIDDDGTAYLIFEDRPFGFRIAKLSDDYMTVEKEMTLVKAPMEGGAIVHYNGLYYSIGSQLTGWNANPNKYATAPTLEGPWTEFKDIAPPATNTYGSQSTMLIKVIGTKKNDHYFYGRYLEA